MLVICDGICCFLTTYREITLSFAIILLTVRVILGMIGYVGNGGARAAGSQFLIDSSGTVFYSDTEYIWITAVSGRSVYGDFCEDRYAVKLPRSTHNKLFDEGIT